MIRVGLTYDLRDDYRSRGFSEEAVAEFDGIDTIVAIEAALIGLGYATDRIGSVRQLAARLVAGDRWEIVFNIAEGVRGRAREAQVPALLDAFDVPYVFSDPLTMAATLDKSVAKRLVRDAGVMTAPFKVLEQAADAANCALPFPVFVKPLAEGTGKGCEVRSRAGDPGQLVTAARGLIARFKQPVLVEPFLPGREFTVGITGNGHKAKVIGVLEVVVGVDDDGVYSLTAKELCESRVRYRLADDSEARAAAAAALDAYRVLQCRDAARVDLRSDAHGLPSFLEVNPIAGLHPSHSDLPILATLAGWSYDRLIASIMTSALERYDLKRPSASRRAA